MAEAAGIKNILFDLGGVILDIDVHATLRGFYDLGFPSELMQYPHAMNTDLFYKYETGKIATDTFRDQIREDTGIDFTNEAFNEAWNAMIVRIPRERCELLKKLSGRYKLFMLSNTSALHVEVFEPMFQKSAGRDMHEVFDKIYYSHEIGWHKPQAEAWTYVLQDAGINAEETLFLDDNIHNIKAAQELGFQAIHIHERMPLMNLGFDL